METLELARHFLRLLEEGDQEKARACYAEDARIWHNFDDYEQDVDENLQTLGWMVKNSRSRRYDIQRLEEIEGGYLQQHVLRIETRSGEQIAMPACVVVQVRDGRIARIEEYLDPASAVKLGGIPD